MRFSLPLIALSTVLTALPHVAVAQERREVPTYREIGIEAASPVREELYSFLDEYRDAWSNEDTEAFVGLHIEDTEWINAYARIFSDSSSLAHFLETRLFPAFGPGVSRTEAENMQLISIRVLGEDTAVLHLFTDGNRGPSAIEDRRLRRTHFHLVLSRENGVWKIAHTAIMDARE